MPQMHYFTFSSSFLIEKVVQFRSIHHCCNPSSDGEDLVFVLASYKSLHAYLTSLSPSHVFTWRVGEWAAPPACHFLSVITALFTVIAHFLSTLFTVIPSFLHCLVPLNITNQVMFPNGVQLNSFS